MARTTGLAVGATTCTCGGTLQKQKKTKDLKCEKQNKLEGKAKNIVHAADSTKNKWQQTVAALAYTAFKLTWIFLLVVGISLGYTNDRKQHRHHFDTFHLNTKNIDCYHCWTICQWNTLHNRLHDHGWTQTKIAVNVGPIDMVNIHNILVLVKNPCSHRPDKWNSP